MQVAPSRNVDVFGARVKFIGELAKRGSLDGGHVVVG